MALHVMNEYDEYVERLKTQINNLKADLDLWRSRALEHDTEGNFHSHIAKKEGAGECAYAVCDICDEMLGWWCEDSPTHVCDYTQEDGSYDEDQCRYCGEPDERK